MGENGLMKEVSDETSDLRFEEDGLQAHKMISKTFGETWRPKNVHAGKALRWSRLGRKHFVGARFFKTFLT